MKSLRLWNVFFCCAGSTVIMPWAASVLLEDSKCPAMVVNCKCIYKWFNITIACSIHLIYVSTDTVVLHFPGVRSDWKSIQRWKPLQWRCQGRNLKAQLCTFLAAGSLPLRLNTSHYSLVVYSGKTPHGNHHHFCIGAPLLLHLRRLFSWTTLHLHPASSSSTSTAIINCLHPFQLCPPFAGSTNHTKALGVLVKEGYAFDHCTSNVQTLTDYNHSLWWSPTARGQRRSVVSEGCHSQTSSLTCLSTG